jgi:hypothetical protein
LSFLPLDHIAKPIVPNAKPATEAPQEKKFKKKVDSNTWMTIKNGRIMPRSIKTTLRIRRRRGELIIYVVEGVFWWMCGASS